MNHDSHTAVKEAFKLLETSQREACSRDSDGSEAQEMGVQIVVP